MNWKLGHLQCHFECLIAVGLQSPKRLHWLKWLAFIINHDCCYSMRQENMSKSPRIHPIVKLVKDYETLCRQERPRFDPSANKTTLNSLSISSPVDSSCQFLYAGCEAHIFNSPSLSYASYLPIIDFWIISMVLDVIYIQWQSLWFPDKTISWTPGSYILAKSWYLHIRLLIHELKSSNPNTCLFVCFVFSLMNFSILVNGNSVLIVGQTPNHGVIIDFPLSLICHT